MRAEGSWAYGWYRVARVWEISQAYCNGHYNRTPDLGKWDMWWNAWDLAGQSILDAKVLDRNVTWLTKHKDTS